MDICTFDVAHVAHDVVGVRSLLHLGVSPLFFDGNETKAASAGGSVLGNGYCRSYAAACTRGAKIGFRSNALLPQKYIGKIGTRTISTSR
jgi:hypothetical protein